MNNPLLSVETSRWIRARRRWTLVLGGLLTINAFLVVMALAGYSSAQRQPVADTHVAPAEPADVLSPMTTTVVAEATAPTASEIQTEPTTTSALEVAANVAAAETTNSLPLAVVATTPDVTNPDHDLPTSLVLDPTAIIVVNPFENGGAVNFLFDDSAYTLEPGEYVLLSACEDTQILYHQGDERDDAQCACPPGIYVFDVSASGWQLSASNDLQGNAVLSACHPAASP